MAALEQPAAWASPLGQPLAVRDAATQREVVGLHLGRVHMCLWLRVGCYGCACATAPAVAAVVGGAVVSTVRWPGGELELRFLTTFCKDAKHYAVQSVLGSGCNGIVFEVKCVHPGAPFPDKVRTASHSPAEPRSHLSINH